MNKYNFLNLSYIEFEALAQDLLQEVMNVRFEIFAEGKDEGVDLRYSLSLNKNIVVQCKRYKNYSDLISILKKEISKIEKLCPHRYILFTSVDLSYAQKNRIFKLLTPFIKNTEDIYSSSDINSLIREFDRIEFKHYKLWLTSSNILDKHLKSKIVNQSKIEVDRIKKLVPIYVMNSGFTNAQIILNQHNFLIISGIPGIGKSSLARVLCYYYLTNTDFKEFVFISNSIDEGYELLKDGVKQVFFYDDFLGQSFDERKLGRNEDKRLVQFIKYVTESKDKLLILTTREYILKDVQSNHEVLNSENINLYKYILDLSVYTRKIRALILYNHLYFSSFNQQELTAFTLRKNYNRIINHKNYSPRIIESIIVKSFIMAARGSNLYNMFIEILENPMELWAHPFNEQITLHSKFLLIILLMCGDPIMLDDLKLAMQEFINKKGNKYGLKSHSNQFNKSLKELEDTFISIEKDDYSNLAVKFQNPSIKDYLLLYCSENRAILIDILYSAIFYNQYYNCLEACNNIHQLYSKRLFGKIACDLSLDKLRIGLIKNHIDDMKISSINSFVNRKDGKAQWNYQSNYYYTRLYTFVKEFEKSILISEVDQFVCSKFVENIELKGSSYSFVEIENYIRLVKRYRELIKIDRDWHTELILSKMNTLYNIRYNILNILWVYPLQVRRYFIHNPEYLNKIRKTLYEYIDYADENEIQLISQATGILERRLNLKFRNIELKIDRYKKRQEKVGSKTQVEIVAISDGSLDSEDEEIDLIFQSLSSNR